MILFLLDMLNPSLMLPARIIEKLIKFLTSGNSYAITKDLIKKSSLISSMWIAR